MLKKILEDTILEKDLNIVLEENLNNKNEKKLFFIQTWGCQMNEEDSEKLSGMLKSIGYSKTDNLK